MQQQLRQMQLRLQLQEQQVWSFEVDDEAIAKSETVERNDPLVDGMMEEDVDLEAGMGVFDVPVAGPLCDLLWTDLEMESGASDDVQCFLRQHGAHLVGYARW
eukprot:14437181-Alexandrium_andersonii.AAC.1